MENISEDIGEQVIAQLRELIRLLELNFGITYGIEQNN